MGKTFKFTSVLLFASLGLFLMSAAELKDRKPVSKTNSERIILTPAKDSVALRPKAPSRQVVTCAYDGEYLMFDFVVPEGECDVVVTEWFSNAQQSYTIDSSILTADIHVGELYESTVTVTTEKGNVYTADLTAE